MLNFFRNGGLVKGPKMEDSIPAMIAPGTVFIKKSSWEKDKGKSLLPFININDEIKIVDDDEWDKRFPHF